jgi:hypothetical protein
LDNYHEEFEGELARMGVDLLSFDSEDGPSLRKLYVLFLAFPQMNLVSMAAAGFTPEQKTWGMDSYILANIFDAVQNMTYALVAMNSPRGRKPKQPKPYPRPGRNNPARPRRGDWFPGETIVSR